MNIIGNTIMIKLIMALLNSVSPLVIAELQSMIDRLAVAAKQSANPWDDILVEFLNNLVESIAKRGN